MLPEPALGDLGRYADPGLVVLTCLAAGPRHGYAIMEEIEELGGPRLRPGTLYAVLARLEQRGLVEALEPEERRRPYRLTPRGAAALRLQLDHLDRVTRVGLARLAAAPA
jgi:DNA-binding PadR family transcriptional regulator